MTRTATTLGALALLALALTSCSEVTQSESDCTTNQFYDDNAQFCRNCPAVTPPTCELGCGFTVATDARGCQVAECDCDACPMGTFYDTQDLSCVDCPINDSPACEAGCPQVGNSVDLNGCVQRRCVCEDACEPPEEPDCGDPGCCDVVDATDDLGCADRVCDCPGEAPEGFYFEEDGGRCLSCEDADPAPDACTM